MDLNGYLNRRTEDSTGPMPQPTVTMEAHNGSFTTETEQAAAGTGRTTGKGKVKHSKGVRSSAMQAGNSCL